MRILIYTLEFPPCRGGAGVYGHDLAKGLSLVGEEVQVLTCRYGPADIWVDNQLPCEVRRVPVSWVPKKDARILDRFLSDWRPDVLIIANHGAQLTVPFSSRLRSLPYAIILFRSDILHQFGPVTSWGEYLRWLRNRRVCFGAARLIAISRHTKELLGLYLPQMHCRTDVVTLCVDTERFLPQNDSSLLRSHLKLEDRKIVLSLSRLVPHKHQDILIRAMLQVRQQVSDAYLLIVGDGPERRRLTQLVRENDLFDCVGFVGEIPESIKPDFYRMCDLFALVSEGEGFGIVYLEASACGKAVLGADSGGTPDAIAAGVSGELARLGDVHDTAAKLIALLNDSERRQRLGGQGRERVLEGFTLRHMGERTLHSLTLAVAAGR